MKKLLLTFATGALLLGVSSANAETAYFYATATAPDGATGTNSVQLTGDVAGNSYSTSEVTISFEKKNNSTSNVNSNLVRWYKDDIIHISGLENVPIKISAVKMSCTSSYTAVSLTEPSGVEGTTNGTEFSATFDPAVSTVSLTATAQTRFSVLEVTYTVAAIGLDPSIGFVESEYSANLGEGFSTPYFMNPNNLPITWSSSNESVATVDNEGNVTLVKAGTTVISATFAGSDTYRPAVVHYNLTVINPNATEAVFNYKDEALDMTATSGIVTISVVKGAKGTTSPTRNTSGDPQLRFYGGNEMTISVPAEYEITKISFTTIASGTNASFVSGSTANWGNWDATNKVWTASNDAPADTNKSEVVITNGGTSGHTKIYTITVEYQKKDTATSIEEIVDAEGEAVYFDLTGRRISEPAKGMFIRVQGGKATKVVK